MANERSLQELVLRAKRVSEAAYAPYSHFPVGAALVTPSGNVYQGCNVENASYGLTICAERNAIFQMVADGEKTIEALVIYTPTEAPSAPCGACRQVIAEFGVDALVVSVCDGDSILRNRLSDLLPCSFGSDALNSN